MDGQRRVRGQASVEIVVTLSVILMVFILMGYVVFQRYVRTTDLKIYITGQRIVNSIADNINTVKSIGDGYSLKTTLPFRMYSTQGYEVVFYKDEPTVFLHGGSFARSRTLYFSAPMATNVVSCNLHECNALCNTSETSVCLQVNRSMDIKIVNYMDGIYLTPEYNLEQKRPGEVQIMAEIRPFTGYNVSADYYKIAANEPPEPGEGRSIMYLYKDDANKSLYLVFNHENMNERIGLNFSDMIGNISVFLSVMDGELNMSKDPEGNWTSPVLSRGGILKVNSNEMRICIDPLQFPGTPNRRWYWLNRGYEKIELRRGLGRTVCLAYP